LRVMASPSYSSIIRHSANVARQNAELTGAAKSLAIRHSPQAGAQLGSQTSKAKSEAAHSNGAKGGRPVGS
jgi:hypothetical protein